MTMQQTRPVKFNFDTVFGNAQQGAARARSTYSPEEVEAIRREMHAQGKADGEVQAQAARAAALGAIAQALSAVIAELDGTIAILREESAATAVIIARKVAENALAAFPLKEVEALVADCL